MHCDVITVSALLTYHNSSSVHVTAVVYMVAKLRHDSWSAIVVSCSSVNHKTANRLLHVLELLLHICTCFNGLYKRHGVECEVTRQHQSTAANYVSDVLPLASRMP